MCTRLTVQHILCNQYYQYAFEPGNCVIGHISAIEGMIIKLRDLGVEISSTSSMTNILLTPSSRFHSAFCVITLVLYKKINSRVFLQLTFIIEIWYVTSKET